jgi:hypothetical protein
MEIVPDDRSTRQFDLNSLELETRVGIITLDQLRFSV